MLMGTMIQRVAQHVSEDKHTDNRTTCLWRQQNIIKKTTIQTIEQLV